MSIAAKARLRFSASRTPIASRPISTFSSTVSQGKSAKLWNTMAMPGGGPATGLPRYSSRAAVGLREPAIKAQQGGLAGAERPSRPTELAFLQS
jgi:hypothetical protein